MTDWCKASAEELGAAYRDGTVSPVEVIDQVLARCERVNARINAIVTLDAEGARMQARASEQRIRRGAALGPLDGVPITVKDNIPVAGMRSTWGSRLYAELVPERDELPVARLRTAGAVILGKTNVPEFTLQGYTDNPLFGPTRNPWNLALTPGGSSGGAVAAVISGLGPIAVGTDGGGSIRRPASHAGLVGLKPSRGRVPRADGFPPILLDFEVIGPIARTVVDVVSAMQVMSAPDARDPLSIPSAGQPFAVRQATGPLRILRVPTFADAPVDPEIGASVEVAAQDLAHLGHRLGTAGEFRLSDAINEAWPTVSQVGLAWLLAAHRDWRGRIGAPLEAMAVAGERIAATKYFDALNTAILARHELGKIFTEYDLLMTPTTAALPWPATEAYPPRIADRDVGPRGHAVFTVLANATGCPAISVPCGFSREGLPIGFQLVGSIGSDELLCAVAMQYERLRPWADRWPKQIEAAAVE
jgi:aspartyl-tRNA(Asn)/glutamyl-tRNA(Gln) amidotransferase subunit A